LIGQGQFASVNTTDILLTCAEGRIDRAVIGTPILIADRLQ
jgi:hypothetical protein